MEHLRLSHILGRKVLVFILFVSSLLSLFATAVQLYNDYRYDVSEIELEFLAIETSHLDSLALNLWDFQDKAVEQQISGIESLPFIHFVQLSTPQGTVYQAGETREQGDVSQTFAVIHNEQTIGELQVDANYQEIYNKLWQKAGVILFTQFIKTLLAAFAIVAIVYWYITRHIYKIADYATDFSLSNLDHVLELDGDRRNKDELDGLVEALNNMRLILKNEFQLRIESEQQLSEFNHHLELKIRQRTQELELSLTQLKETQATLVQSEKMVALGQLVAGIAHEINTPLGISVTANSVMLEAINNMQQDIDEGTLTKTQLAKFMADQIDTGDMLQRNLNRAIDLIKSFKSVAVNQSNDSLLRCNIPQLVNEVLATVRTMFKAKNYQIELQIPKDLHLVTYPGAWTQILTNLLMNSHIHGFDGEQRGRIKIAVELQNDRYKLVYQDDGKGIPEDMIDKVFDPFVTTKRGKGGSGLGLNILFNLVFEKLDGSVKVENLASGCQFTLDCPVVITPKR